MTPDRLTKLQALLDKSPGDPFLWYAIGLAVVACICALLYFVRHVNKEEEIHITQ